MAVGFGDAGAATAITAHDLGVTVLPLQKAPEEAEGGNTPIPRLYNAGELGSIYDYLYPGTGNIGECLAFGRICARNAVAESLWDE